jgi:hypothetical protein
MPDKIKRRNLLFLKHDDIALPFWIVCVCSEDCGFRKCMRR